MRRLRCRWPFEPWSCSACGKLIEGAAPVSVVAGLVCEPCIDLGRRGEPFIPLTVRMVEPRTALEYRPILAVSMRDGRCVTEQGEAFDLPELVARIRDRQQGEIGRAGAGRDQLPEQLAPCFVVTDSGLDLLAYLDQSPAGASSLWQWQANLRAPSAWRPEARSRSTVEFVVPKPVRFGYASRRGGRRHAEGRARWYELIDVHTFCELPDGWGEPDPAELLRFGLELRDWSNRERLPVCASASAYGGRLLRDARFGGGWRRKIPAATNRILRRRLPGNHYQLLTATDLTHSEVHKLDQAGAHHYAALKTRFPHPDEMRADGWFRRDPPREGTKVDRYSAIPAFTDRWAELIDRPGLFTIAVHVPERVSIDELAIPALRAPGTRWRTVTSVEIAHLRSLQPHGVGLGDIWSCWTSPDVDERLNEYAYWTGQQLANVPQQTKRWLKPALLAAYGLLAAKPRRHRTAWRWCAKPDGAVGFQTSHGTLVGYERAGKRERETQTANVLWRVLIESSVRLESLTFAQQLRAGGYRPIAVYADAVFAIGDGEPAAPAPWRYEGTIHDLTFDSPARYRSREETRLPGTPRGRGSMGRPAAYKAADQEKQRRLRTKA